MQKTIDVYGVPLRLESNAATPLFYKKQFGKDYFADMLKIAKSMAAIQKITNINNKEAGETENKKEIEIDVNAIDNDTLNEIDLDPAYNMIWALAKTAVKTIPEPLEFYSEFDEFSIIDVTSEAMELIMHSFNSKKK